jgi:hypothetical protein
MVRDEPPGGVTGLTPKVPVTFAGWPLTLSVTGEPKPPIAVVVIVTLPLFLRGMVSVGALAPMAKSGLGVAGPTVTPTLLVGCVRAPLTPVTVTGVGPPGVVDETVKVVPWYTPFEGETLAVVGVMLRPAGWAGVRVTVPAKPPTGVIETPKVPVLPLAKVMLVGLAATEKSGGGVTVTPTLLVGCVRLPLTPVTVTGVGPPRVEDETVNVVPWYTPFEGETLTVVGVMLSPVGCAGVSVTVPAKPATGVIETPKVPVAPLRKLMLVGLAVTEKSGVAAAETVTATLLVGCERLPLVPVTVTGVGPPGVVDETVKVVLA